MGRARHRGVLARAGGLGGRRRLAGGLRVVGDLRRTRPARNAARGRCLRGELVRRGYRCRPRSRAAPHRRWRGPMTYDGIVSRYLNRPLSRPMARALKPTAVTPNAVTAFTLLLALATGAAIAAGWNFAG